MWVVDVVGGDLSAALLLSQLLWWHQREKVGLKKTVTHNGHEWMVRTDDDWWTDCRLTMRQVRRIRRNLEEAGFVEHKVIRVESVTVSAWRPHLEAIQAVMERNEAAGQAHPGLTPAGQSRSDANVSLRDARTDPDASLPSDARASVHSLLSLTVKEEQVAASRPQPQARSDAEDIVRAWWETSTPTPVNSRIGVVKVVERFLLAGYEDQAVALALRSAPCPTVNALLIELNGTRPNTAATTEKVLEWLMEGNEDGQ